MIVTAREEDRDFLERLGADEVIDYKKEQFEKRVSDVDLVFDLIAGEVQRRSWKVLAPGGRLISTLRFAAEGRSLATPEPRPKALAT